MVSPSPKGTTTSIWPLVALLFSLALYLSSIFLPVWDIRSDFSGQWTAVDGMLPLAIGFLGVLVLCPAWFANLLLIPLCITLFKKPTAGFWISLPALAIAATAYMLPAIYGDNEAGIIIHRRIGFYLWLASFISFAIAHAWLIGPAGKPSPVARTILLALPLLLVVSLQLAYPVGVSPMEESLRDPNNLQALRDALAQNPPQAQRDAAFYWALKADFSLYFAGPGSRRVDALIAAGANVDYSPPGESTALMHAVSTPGADTLVDTLIRAGANVNARDSRGKSVLDIARASQASPNIIRLLTNAGARPG